MLLLFTVIANTLMEKERSNIFSPLFVLKERPRVLQQTIESWCDANKIEASSIAAAENLAVELEVISVSAYEEDAV